MTEQAPPGPVLRRQSTAAASGRPLRCLLVEDSRFDRSLVRYSAERGGIAIDFVDAPTLAEARQTLAAQDFELIILDRRLPDGDGLDLPLQLGGEARNSGVPMIMLSGGDADDLVPASARAGCISYIAKQDLSPEGLTTAIREALLRRMSSRDGGSEELQLVLAALSDVSRVARMRPFASRLMTVVSDLRRSMADVDSATAMALEEMSELCLMLWLELDGPDRDGQKPRFS